MSYSILLVDSFEKELKRLCKKHPSLKQDLSLVLEQLLENPLLGTPIGNNCYKIRIAIKSKGKGKSGGARIITYVLVSNEQVYLLSIFDKAEAVNISDVEILKRINKL